MNFKSYLKIQEMGEVKLINMGLVAYISISDKSIALHFSIKESLTFTESQLGLEEFKYLKNSLIPTPTPRVERI